ncbi:polyprenyl diphosphate synthase [Marinicella rhabdoformis]|uniref:polyprenyl diphosphate synthase n=1 Tax=Marinicella rhabdoformis TaxID=2580566 RepID=UPI0012AED372|nr:polyprenyl diphosphate synthase [Marinicella rhabdoformis]
MSIQHIAIIMDGNGRWATQRKRPRTMGHQAGVKAVRKTIQAVAKLGIPHLTLFAFSSENWNRPEKEVSKLMDLFLNSIQKETPELNAQGVRLNFIGDLSRFSEKLQTKMSQASSKIPENQRLMLNIAVNYGGQWDIVQAAKQCCEKVLAAPELIQHLGQEEFAAHLSLSGQPDVDVLIRTGGEHRISNFLLWQSAYAEIFFEDMLWPDFDETHVQSVVERYLKRERRFGQTSEQINA